MNIEEIDARLAKLENEITIIIGRVDDSAHHVGALNAKMDRIHSDLLELIELWCSAKGFVKVVKWTGTAVKWVVGTGAAIVLALTAIGKGLKF